MATNGFDPSELTFENPRHAYMGFGNNLTYQSYADRPADGVLQGKPKFTFVVEFETNVTTSEYWTRSIYYEVKSIDRPKINLETQDIPQYNKHRQVYKQIQYQPFQIRFYDTVANAVQEMFNSYAAHYFGDFRRKNPDDWRNDVVSQEFRNNSDFGWGFNPIMEDGAGPGDINYFKTIKVHHLYGDWDYRTTFVNPRITSFDPDEVDFERNEFNNISLSFAYEGLINETIQISKDDEIKGFINNTLNGGGKKLLIGDNMEKIDKLTASPNATSHGITELAQEQLFQRFNPNEIFSTEFSGSGANTRINDTKTVVDSPSIIGTNIPDDLSNNNVSLTSLGSFTNIFPKTDEIKDIIGPTYTSVKNAVSETTGRTLDLLGLY